MDPTRRSKRLASSAAHLTESTAAADAGARPPDIEIGAGRPPKTAAAPVRGAAQPAAISDSAAATPAADAGRGSPAAVPDSVPSRRHRRRGCENGSELASAKEAPRRPAPAAEKSPSAFPPEQASARRSRRRATNAEESAPEIQAAQDSLPAHEQRSRRRAGEAATGSGRTPTPPHVRRPIAAAAMQAAVTAQAGPEHSRRRPDDAKQTASALQTVQDSVPAPMQRSRRRAGEAAANPAQTSSPAHSRQSTALGATQAAGIAGTPTKQCTPAALAPAPAPASGRRPTCAAVKPLVGAAAALAAEALLSSPAAAPCLSGPQQAQGLGCSRCRQAPKGCSKCRPKLLRTMQSRAAEEKPDRAERSATPAAQPQQETVDHTAPVSMEELCRREPDIAQVSRVFLTLLALWSTAFDVRTYDFQRWWLSECMCTLRPCQA